MSEAKFTKGPWTAVQVACGDYRIQYNPQGNWLGLIYHDDHNPDIAKADADVAAAAPELYEALELCLADLKAVTNVVGRGIMTDKAISCADSALAKARGER